MIKTVMLYDNNDNKKDNSNDNDNGNDNDGYDNSNDYIDNYNNNKKDMVLCSNLSLSLSATTAPLNSRCSR